MVATIFDDNPTQARCDSAGSRRKKRVTLTDNQKVVLLSMYEWEVHNSPHTIHYYSLKPKARWRAILALRAKGLIDDYHWTTEQGRSYARRLRGS